MTPKALFICRGSVADGLGHIIRSRTIALAMQEKAQVEMVIIGDETTRTLLFHYPLIHRVVMDEMDALFFYEDFKPDIVFFDLLEFNQSLFEKISTEKLTISLSPIFNCQNAVDVIFHRSRYFDQHWLMGEKTPLIKNGLQYAIVGEHTKRIPSKIYKFHLKQETLAVAISMGGTDAANKTLKILQTIKEIPEKLLVWAILGEGYTHSYQQLIDCIKDSNHEIILAKTNDSMWRILSTCSVALLTGGVTTYEAAYAGLPSINLLQKKAQFSLLEELVDHGVTLTAGDYFSESLDNLNNILSEFYQDRDKLLAMHQNSKGLVDNQAAHRIVDDSLAIYGGGLNVIQR